MRNATKRKYTALSALAAAGLAGWAGTPAAKGDFSVSVVNMSGANGISYQGNTWDVWVLTTTNNGTGAGQAVNTGSTLEVLQAIIDTGDPTTFGTNVGALGIDVEQTTVIGGTKASNSKYAANVNGATIEAFGQGAVNNQNTASPPVFGDITGGTFVGVGTGTFTTDIANNGQNTQDGANSPGSKGGTAAVYVNSQTSDYVASGNTAANYLNAFLNPSAGNRSPILDQAFENGTQSTAQTATANAGNVPNALANGTVHSLEVDSVSEDSSGNVLPVAADPGSGGNIPFANIVVPHGTIFTIHGGLAGDAGGTQAFSTIVGGGSPPPPPSTLVLKITPTSGAGGTNIGTATVVGSNGSYHPVTVPVPGGQASTGNLTITGFAPASDQEIVGLDAVGANSLTQLFTDLQAALQATNPGATVFAPTGSAAGILAAASDNVEILLPSGSLPGVMPESLSYDTSGYNTNGAVTLSNITVLPEPTSLGALALGGLGLLSRRRRRAKA